MQNILVVMNEDGHLRCSNADGGYIEEMKARQLVFSLNDFFRSSVISYFTVSFEPYGLGKKIVTDNIYKDGISDELYYSAENGTLVCPIYDYVSVSPRVSVQIDGYETDSNSDVCAIYKSGILSLYFSDSLVGDKIVPDFKNGELKLSERIADMIDDELDDLVVTGVNIADAAVTTSKIADTAVTDSKIQSVGSGKVNQDSTHRFVTDAEKSTWSGKYSKPSGGIPKTDLESGVQTSLDKADSALQSHQDISGKADISDIPTALSDLTDDLGNSPTHTHNQYLISHQDISGKENVSNKVTTIDLSAPSNTNYPSESAVVTYMNNTVGAINTQLDTINGTVI